MKTEAFHVTIIDTKEFYEDTPAVLRLMADKDSDTKGLWDMAAVQFKDILKGKGELIVGACTAIRSDHVLVGTSGGIGARAVPYDYLVISTGTSYKSDIKTEGTSIAARRPRSSLSGSDARMPSRSRSLAAVWSVLSSRSTSSRLCRTSVSRS